MKRFNIYYVDHGSYVSEVYENSKDEFVTGTGVMFQCLGVTGEELLRFLDVPEKYISVLCYIFRLPRTDKIYLYQLKDFIAELKKVRIFKETLTREDIIARTLRQEAGVGVEEVKELLKELIENIEP